jgi:hypothetical protein
MISLILKGIIVYLAVGVVAAIAFHRYCRKAFDPGVASFVSVLWGFMAAGFVKKLFYKYYQQEN